MSVEVSSTGDLGFALRSNERAYLNFPEYVDVTNISDFVDKSTETLWELPNTNPEVTRFVVRATMETSALHSLLDDPYYFGSAEAVAQIDDQSSLVYFANNTGERRPHDVKRAELARKIKAARELTPHTQTLGSGFGVTDTITSPEHLYGLWEETFEWSLDGCVKFAQTIDQQKSLAPTQRSAWFRGMEHGGVLVAATMAERLDMPGRDGGSIALIENSEWAAAPELRGHGLGRILVKELAATIESDLDGITHLQYAECNITSGAYIMAMRAGLSIPEITTKHGKIPQVIHQNVRVGDGYEPKNGYRDFAFVTAK